MHSQNVGHREGGTPQKWFFVIFKEVSFIMMQKILFSYILGVCKTWLLEVLIF